MKTKTIATKVNKIDKLIDKGTIALMLGYSTVRSVNNLINRHLDFPKPVISAIGRGNKSQWLHTEVVAWFKKYQKNQQLLKLQQSKEIYYMRKSTARNLIDDAADAIKSMVEIGVTFGAICDYLNNIKHLPEALDVSVSFNCGDVDYFISNNAALIDVLSDRRYNKAREKKMIARYGDVDFKAEIIDHPAKGLGYSCRLGEPSAFIGASGMLEFYGQIIVRKL